MSTIGYENHDKLYGPTTLLLLQAVERCNLNCTYCYLPNRTKKGEMSLKTVTATIRWLRDNGLLGESLEVLWHAGEPLLAGLRFYQRAHKILCKEMPSSTTWKFVFQTNGTLINNDWASFFAHIKAQIGISIDGPREWQDARRRTWGGKSSYYKTIRGVNWLKQHEVPFSTLSVLSEHALRDPARLYNFLCDLGAESFGFNDEEQEGAHLKSKQYESETACKDAEHFYSILYQLATNDNSYGKIREVYQSLEALHSLSRTQSSLQENQPIANEMSNPFSILNVSFNGDFSTFSPELLGHNVKEVGKFIFGNVQTSTLNEVVISEKFQLAHRLIQAGISECRSSCSYYGICGGGSPSNKYFENGRLDSSITMFCQLSIIAPRKAVLAQLEAEHSSAPIS